MTNLDNNAALPFVFCDYATRPLDALAKDVITLSRANRSDLSHYVIWCDSRNVIHSIKLALLAAARSAGIHSLLLPQIIPFQDWVFQQKSPQGTLISETNKQLLLVEAIRHSPGLFQTHNAWPLAKELVSLFNECTLDQLPLNEGEDALRDTLLKKYAITIANVSNISRESEIIYRLWQAYQEQIKAREWIDPLSYYSKTLLTLQPQDKITHYFIVGYHRFSAIETLFFQRLQQHSCISIYYPSISHTLFGCHHHPHLKITDNTYVVQTTNPRQQALNIIYQRNQTTYERIQQFTQSFPENIFKNWLSLYCCNSIERHVHAVCLQAKKWLLEGIEPIGIVASDRLLARRIRAVLEEEGILPTDMGGWTLSTTSAATSIEVFLDALESNFKKDNLLDLLSSPFLPNNFDYNENYQQQIHQIKKLLKHHRNNPADSLDSLAELISAQAKKYEITLTETLDVCTQIKLASQPLNDCKLKGEYELYTLSTQLLTALEKLGIRASLERDAAGQQLLEVLVSNTHGTRSNSIKINWKEWRQWLRDLFEYNFFIPKNTDKRITLCGLEHIDNLSFKAAIVSGVEENRLNNSKSQRTFFNEKVRHELNFLTTHESSAINFVRFRQLLEQCEHILLSAEAESNGEPQELCSWVKLIELFSQQSYSSSLQDTLLDPLLASLVEAKLAKSNFTYLAAQRPAPVVPAELIKEKISATQYQSLIDCPYQYFAKYALSLREQDTPEEFEASDFGQLVHKSLYAFHFDNPHIKQNSFVSTNRDYLVTQLHEISRDIFMHAPFQATVKEGWLQRWQTNIPAYISWAIDRSQHWHALRGEAPLEVRLSTNIILQGNLDRIDSDNQHHAVIDYKTGSTKPSQKKVENGETVQLPFYALLDEKIIQAEYLALGSQGEVKSHSIVSDQKLATLKEEHISRLEQLFTQIRNQTPLPANGDDNTCRVCDYEGLCRKSHWQKPEESATESEI